MGKLGERASSLKVVDEGVEEEKSESPPSEPVEEQSSSLDDTKKRKLSEKQLESLRVGREKNIRKKKERKNAEDIDRLRQLISEEMEKRQKTQEKQDTINTQVEVKIFALVILYFVIEFLKHDVTHLSFADSGLNASSITAFPSN